MSDHLMYRGADKRMTNPVQAFEETLRVITDRFNAEVDRGDLVPSTDDDSHIFSLDHFEAMFEQMKQPVPYPHHYSITEELKWNRWLGWLQGVSMAHGWLTFEEARTINEKAK